MTVMSTPDADSQPSQHGILFFPDKSFVSNHMKFQNFPAERSVSPYWENLVFGALVDEVWWGPPSHIRCERGKCLPTSCLWHGSVHWYRLLKVRTQKKNYFLEVRNCLLDCTSQIWVLWPGLSSSPPCKQAELALSQVTCVQSTNK